MALLNFLPITVESHNKTLFVVSLNDTELETSAKIRLCNVIKFFRVKQVLTFQALKVTALLYKYMLQYKILCTCMSYGGTNQCY